VFSERVQELEGQLADRLTDLLRESRRSLAAQRRCAARRGEASLAQAILSGGEAELTFRRKLEGGGGRDASPGGGERATEAELRSLASASGAAAPTVGASQVVDYVGPLVQACQRQIPLAARNDADSRTLATISGLGQLLVELDRECTTLAATLVSTSEETTPAWAEQFSHEALHGPSSLPSTETLARHIDFENELLREVLNT